MFPDENEIRRSLSERAVRTGSEAWSDVASRLKTPALARGRGRFAMGAALLLLLAAALWQRDAGHRATADRPRGFEVSRIESHGRPADAVVLQPDRDTVLVVVSE